MRVHRNAKTNVYQRRAAHRRGAAAGLDAAQAAEALGVSVRTVAKWLAAATATALADRSSRPASPAAPHGRDRRSRRSSRCDAPAPPRGKSARALRHAALDRHARAGARRASIGWRSLEPRGPGAALRVAARRRSAASRSQTPRPRRRHRPSHPRRSAAPARARVGWEYLHVAIDDATRLTYAEVLPADDAPACAAFLQRTLAWFRRRGVRIRRLLTDNAMAYRARVFAAVCRRWRCVIASRGPIARRPTAKPSASFRRCCASGRTACPIAARRGAPPRSALSPLL